MHSVLAAERLRIESDAAAGVKIGIPESFPREGKVTKWGHSWASRGGIQIDSLAFASGRTIEDIYARLIAIKGRVFSTQSGISEGQFVLIGRDADGSGFYLAARQDGNTVRGFSVVYTEARRREYAGLVEEIAKSFELLSTSAEDWPQVPSGHPVGITVQPNIGTPQRPEYTVFSPDKHVLATSDSQRIKIWDIATGRLLRTLEHYAYNTGIAFAPDGQSILAAYKDGSVRIWDMGVGAITATIEVIPASGEEAVSALTVDEKRNLLLAGTQGGVMAGIALSTRQKLFTMKLGEEANHGCGITALAFSADGTELIAVSSFCGVKWLDLKSKTVTRSFKLPSEAIHYLNYLGNDLFLVQDGYGCNAEVSILDISRRASELVQVLAPVTCPQETGNEYANKGEPSILVHTASGTLFSGRNGFEGVDIWDLKARRLKGHMPWRETDAGGVAAIAGDLEFAAVSNGPVIQIRRLDTGAHVRDLSTQGYEAQTIFMSADQQTLNLMKTNGSEQKLLTLPVGGAVPSFVSRKSKENIYYFGLSTATGRVVALEKKGDNAQAAYVFKVSGGSEILRLPLQEDEGFWSAKISPDGSRVLLTGSRARLLDADTGQVLRNFTGSQTESGSFLWSGTLSEDGKFFALAWPDGTQGGVIEVWNMASLRVVKRVPVVADNQCTSLLFSADNKLLVCGSRDAGIYIHDIATGKLIRSFERKFVAGHVNTASLALSGNGKLIAAGPGQRAVSTGDVGRETGIHVWDLASGKLRFILRGHEDNVYALAFTSDGRWLMSGSVDGTIRYWDVNTGAPAATFASSKDGRWVMISEKGFFAASADAGDLLSVVQGYRAISIDQLWQSLYNPDLLREVLAGDPHGEVRRAADVLNLDKVIDSGPAPAVEISSPFSGSRSRADLVTVTAHILDRGKGVGRIEWRINSVTVGVTNAVEGAGPDYVVKRDVALDPGDNAIEVLAYNASNLLASLPAQTTIAYTGPTNGVRPRLHILAIGINAYTSVPKLDLAVADAKALAEEMKKAGASMYSEVRVRTLLDGEADGAGLSRAVEEFAADIHPRDSFVLFAAAHGFSQGGRFYLIPQDYPGEVELQTLAARAIGQERLQDWIANRIKAKKAIILLDTCESGALTQGYGRSRLDRPASEAAIGRLHEATGRPVLTAAAEGQEALEITKLGHGVFTSALIDALHHARTDENGYIRVSDLAAHVQDLVPKLVAGGEGRSAIPRPARGSQSARFGTTGSDFALVKRLQ
jgi:WD40 repeat protein